LTNSKNDNIDVYAQDSPQVLKSINIQGRQMNCSVVTSDKVFIGCRDRRVFIYNKFSLELLKTLEVPESVHCMCTLSNNTEVAIGMTDGHVIILGSDSDLPSQSQGTQIKNAGHLRDIGGIWSICAINNDTQLALGCISGMYILDIGVTSLTRTGEKYLEDGNIWNVVEYDVNKIACTMWNEPHIYTIDRNLSKSKRKPEEIKDKDKDNDHITDLITIPSYHPQACPFLIKRGATKLELIDIRHRESYILYDDDNNRFGYNKVAMTDRGNKRFQILFVANEGETDQIIKRYDWPNVFEEGLRKIVNLRCKREDNSFLGRIFN